MRDINTQVRELLLGARARDTKKIPAEFDMVDMPVEGVAAYWLSLKKVLLEKKNSELLLTEAAHTKEIFVRHVLELCSSTLDPGSIRRFAKAKKEVLLGDLHRKFVLLAIALLGIADNENPQKVMVRFLSKFAISPVFEKQVFEVAQLIISNLDNGSFNRKKFMSLHIRMKPEALLIVLVVYCMLVRRKGVAGLDPFVEYIRNSYFLEGLNLIRDGFDKDFVKYRLNLQKKVILEESEWKMDMSTELGVALTEHVSYDDMYLIAKSYMLS
ncbi:hypothetical protein [Desulfoplanes sp.]